MEVLDDTLVRNLSSIAERLAGGLEDLAKRNTQCPTSIRLACACALTLADQLADIVREGDAMTAIQVTNAPL